MLREGCKVRKEQVFGGWEMLLFESYLGSHYLSPRRIAVQTHPIGSYQRACFAPIASAMIAVTKLLMLTPSFSACFVNFEYRVRGRRWRH